LTAIREIGGRPLAMEPAVKPRRATIAHQQQGEWEMKKIVVLSALAVFALGAVVGRASVSVAPPAAAEVFLPASVVLVNPSLSIENYDAI
jgi:hypothetical protein